MKIRIAGLFIVEVHRKRKEATVHFVKEHEHELRLMARSGTVAPVLNRTARFDVALFSPKDAKERHDADVPIASICTLVSYDIPPNSQLLILDARARHLRIDDTPIDRSKPPTPSNFGSVRWLPQAKDLLGGQQIDDLEISSTFSLTDGDLSAGWTDIKPWVVVKDPDTEAHSSEKEQYFANHLVYEVQQIQKRPVVIKAHCGWFAMHDDKAEITIANLPRTSPELDQRMTNDREAATMPGMNHFNHYNRVLGTFHEISFRPPAKKRAPIANVPTDNRIPPFDPDHCFPTMV